MDNLTIIPLSKDMLEDLIRKVLTEVLNSSGKVESTPKPFLTTKEVCEILHKSRPTINKLREQKRLTPIQDCKGGKMLFKYEDVLSLSKL